MKFCIKCGNQLEDAAVFCSRCGTQTVSQQGTVNSAPQQTGTNSAPQQPVGQPAPAQVPQKHPVNILALLGFIFGLVSWLLNFWGIVGIAAIVLSAISLPKLDPTNTRDKTLAIIGLISGIINVLYVVVILFVRF